MVDGLGTPRLSLAVQDNVGRVLVEWRAKMENDPEFSEIEAGPEGVIKDLADTLIHPQDVLDGPDDEWLRAVIDLASDARSIGITGRKLRYLGCAVEEVVIGTLPDDERVESTSRLYRAIVFGIESAARSVAREISTLAFHSRVTQLRNDVAFEIDLKDFGGYERPFQLAYVDMDGLKILNDEYGHAEGDAALARLAAALQRSCGDDETAYHLSGDEFAVVSENCAGGHLEDIIKRASESECPGFSFGVACSREGETVPEVRHLADRRMHSHKQIRKERGEAPERPGA